MSRDVQQRQRTQDNPLNLGSFSRTSLRYLKGSLGPVYKPVGRSDTRSTSNGGIGGGSYNHWFKVTLLTDAWIIVAKGPPRPQYIQVSAYDLNQNPIQERGILDADSIPERQSSAVYYPYVGQVMGAQSDLYNTFNPARLDKGNDIYFPLTVGSYLLCISTTRNEPLDYGVGLVIEVEDLEQTYLLETGGLDFLIYENAIATNNTEVIGPTFSSDFVIAPGMNIQTKPLQYFLALQLQFQLIQHGLLITIQLLRNKAGYFLIPLLITQERPSIYTRFRNGNKHGHGNINKMIVFQMYLSLWLPQHDWFLQLVNL